LEVYLIVVSIILLLVFIAGLVDLLPLVKRWLSRIHIGQWQSSEEWKTAVEDVLLAQLKKTPQTPLSDNTRLTVIERIKGQYSNSSLQQWQQASLLLGANNMCECEEVKKRIDDFVASKINSEGQWRRFEVKPETAMLAFAILASPATDKIKMKPAMEKTVEMLFDLAEKSGTVPYNSNIPDIRFVDTVGMICPFLARYALDYDCPRALTLAKSQIQEYVKNGIHEKLRMPVHCFNVISDAPLGIYGWGRGCGWWALGLMDTYLVLTDGSSISGNSFMREEANVHLAVELKEFLLREMTGFANALLEYQMENGAWDRQVFLMTSGESSATAMLAWYMKKMYEITSEDNYSRSYNEAIKFLQLATRRDGTVDFAQGDTMGIGFYAVRLDIMPAAQGFVVKCI